MFSSPIVRGACLFCFCGFLMLAGPARAQPDPSALESWETDGDVAVDTEQKHTGSAGALRLGPGAKMLLPLRSEADSGRVVMWVYDDGTTPPAEQLKERHVGPRWGIIQPDGQVLAGAVMYAPYLAGDLNYVISEPDQKIWTKLKGAAPRSPGWHEWDFDFDAEAGLTIRVNGQPAKRFDWNSTKMEGFSGLVLYGDSPNAEHPQTLWVDDIEVTLGPPMKVRPAPPETSSSVVPDKDPAPEGAVPELSEAVKGKHPRLLFTAESLPGIREFYFSEAGAAWRKQLESYLPACTPPDEAKFLTDATDAQRQGFWKLPTVALHYALTGDKASYERAVGFLKKFNDLPHWETGKELDSGMSAANIMVGAALAYDWLYNDLDPEFRETFRRKLLDHARAMFYGGHLKKNGGSASHYWQNDPQNNHRWHRDAGLTLAVLAAYEGSPDEQWILGQTAKELEFVAKWLPADGTSHESPSYLVFGGNHLTLAMQASDECLGTKFLDAPFFRTVGYFISGTAMPGFGRAFGFGDWDGSGFGHYGNFLLKAAAMHHQPDVKEAVLRVWEREPSSMAYGWFSLLWDNPGLPRGDASKLPTAAFWPDIGLAIVRDSWNDDAVAALFKCGPFGGYLLNEFSKQNGGSYINVAHDDPDANAFVLAIGGELLAETDRYAKSKMSRAHNTILVNELGQMVEGRSEGLVFSQPGGDMTKMAVVTAWRDTQDIVAVEGEASGSYLAYNGRKGSRPPLDRFRRTFLWVKNAYVLVFDDIRAPEPVEITWLMQGPDLKPLDESAGRFELVSANHRCPFQVVSDAKLTFSVGQSPAESRGRNLGFRQLQAKATAPRLFIVSVYDPWNVHDLSARIENTSPDEATIIVEGADLKDAWHWKAGADRFLASTVEGDREKGRPNAGFPFRMDAASAKPTAAIR